MVIGDRLKRKVVPYAAQLKGIAHAHRLAILYLLAHDPLEVREIVWHLKLPDSLVAHHLKEMRKSGWIKRMKVGKRVTYELDAKAIREFRKLFADTRLERELVAYYRKKIQ